MKPAQELDLVDENAPVASSHIWCPGCGAVMPYVTRLLHPASRKNRADCEANDLVCKGCNAVVATVYLKAEQTLAA